MTPLSHARIEAIRAYCAAATEGPWSVTNGSGRFRGFVATCGQDEDECIVEQAGDFWKPNGAKFDAEFIANARQDLPALLEAYGELQKKLALVRDQFEELIDTLPDIDQYKRRYRIDELRSSLIETTDGH